ncbi:MAG: cyclic nucleotide-binding domain-containing protein [Spirochaetales bacterium]|jgi:CRP-like cAMP-binding protein/anti-anti-sigma regulatory factor|nr:cyclic nucleotide-binding domain-containing protein [Spirochaetales bacterium]
MGKTKLVRFTKDQVLFRENDTSREMYIIRSGKVLVTITKHEEQEEVPLVELGKGSFVGEMAFISGIPRSATVTATESVTASSVSTDLLTDDEFGLSNWSLCLAKVLVQRIRTTTAFLGNFLSANRPTGVPLEVTIDPSEQFSMVDNEEQNPDRLYLMGFLTVNNIDQLKNRIREMKRKDGRPITLDFSNVIDLDNAGLEYLSGLVQMSGSGNQEIKVDNIQLIRNKVLAIKGIQSIIATADMPVKRIKDGEHLICQDQIEDSMFVVKEGKFRIYRAIDEQEVLLAHAEAGDVIGEMALVKGGPRSANVQAVKQSVVYVIAEKEFYRNTYNVADWFMNILKGLVNRLRETNLMLDAMIAGRKEQETKESPAEPLGMVVDSNHPGKFILHGHLIIKNMKYLSMLISGMLDEGENTFILDLSKVEAIDRESIQYLLTRYTEIQSRGGKMSFEGPQKDITKLLQQYDIDS